MRGTSAGHRGRQRQIQGMVILGEEEAGTPGANLKLTVIFFQKTQKNSPKY
jgi:hypothetical protein